MTEHDVAGDEVFFDATRLEVTPTESLTMGKFSSNSIGRVLTILLDGGKISLQTQRDPDKAVWVGSFKVPTKVGAISPASFVQHLRGAIEKDENARVSIMGDLAGKKFDSEFPYDERHEGDFILEFATPVASPFSGSYTATILMIVERRSSESAVLVNFDSMDAEARLAE